MINRLNANKKVGRISINLNDYTGNSINIEAIRMMTNSYKNVYSIEIYDNNDHYNDDDDNDDDDNNDEAHD